MDLMRSLHSGKNKHPEGDRRRKPKLERKNAEKNIDYEVTTSRSREISPASSSVSPQSMYSISQKSFRINGEVEKNINSLFESLGFCPEDFAITSEELEEAGMISSPAEKLEKVEIAVTLPPEKLEKEEIAVILPAEKLEKADIAVISTELASPNGREENSAGIKGPRPPKLVPPALMPMVTSVHSSIRVLDRMENEQKDGSTDCGKELDDGKLGNSDQEEEGDDPVDQSPSCSSSSSSDFDSPIIVEGAYYISSNANLKREMLYWRKGKRLGSGSFGTVFEGISNNGFFFAIKEVSLLDGGPDAKQCIFQLEQEIALLSQFQHENIVEYYGTDKVDSYLYIFLELVSQGSLASLYQSYSKLTDSQVSVYTRQILSGLKYLHERNVVHRDIKCANILVDVTGSVKLADFGLAKQISKLNEMKSSKGSAYWMAPEVINPKGSYGPPADIWSLGCTVLEMLTGQVPYPGHEWFQVMMKVARGGQPDIPTNLSRDARDFILQCVQWKSEDRPTAAALLEHPFAMLPLRTSSGSGSSHGRRRSHTPRHLPVT